MELISSAISSRGSITSARATATRCRCPPLRECPRRQRNSSSQGRCTSESAFMTASFRSGGVLSRIVFQGRPHNLFDCQALVERGKRILKNDLNTAFLEVALIPKTGSPLNNTVPLSAPSTPDRISATVVFPSGEIGSSFSKPGNESV